MKKQLTAVEWFAYQLNLEPNGWMKDLIEQAKEMEREQLGKFYNHGQWTTVHGDTFEDRYNKIFKSE